MRKPSLVAFTLAGLLAIVCLPAAADEIWIAAGEKGDTAVGDWGVTTGGDAHFRMTSTPSPAPRSW